MARQIIKLYLQLIFLTALAKASFFSTYQLFLTSLGLNLLEINLVNCFFGLGSALLEIPTGIVADLWGRRFSMIFGYLLLSLSFLIYFFAASFWICVTAEIIGALGATFISGASEAWLVDSLNFHNCRLRLEKILDHKQKIETIGIIVGVMAGSYLGGLNLAYPWIISSLGMLLAAFYLFYRFPEAYFVKKNNQKTWQKINLITKKSLSESIKKPVFYNIMLLTFIFSCAIPSANMYWSIIYKKIGHLEVWGVGLFFLLILLSLRLGTKTATKIQSYLPYKLTSIILTLLGVGLGLILASFFSPLYLSLLGFFIHEFCRGGFQLLQQTYLNYHLQQETRATMLSINSMASGLGLTLGLIISGIIAKNYSISLAWKSSGIFIIIALTIFLLTKKTTTN